MIQMNMFITIAFKHNKNLFMPLINELIITTKNNREKWPH